MLLQDSEKYVEELLSLFNRFSKLVEEAFHNDPRFLTARDKVNVHAQHLKAIASYTKSYFLCRLINRLLTTPLYSN